MGLGRLQFFHIVQMLVSRFETVKHVAVQSVDRIELVGSYSVVVYLQKIFIILDLSCLYCSALLL